MFRIATYTNSKTWLLILLFVFELITMIRYCTYNLHPKLYLAILITNNFIESYCFFLICYYYAHKGLSEESTTKVELMKIMKYLIIASFPVYAAMTIWQWIELESLQVEGEVDIRRLCKTSFFIIPYAINVLSSGFFIYITWRIAKYLRKIDNNAKKNVYDSGTQ